MIDIKFQTMMSKCEQVDDFPFENMHPHFACKTCVTTDDI